jgi:hypothetical protein
VCVSVFRLRIVGILQPLHDAACFMRAIFHSFMQTSHSTHI